MRIDRSLLNWGVFLIALGIVPLAVQQGWADASIAGDLWRLWPLILVGVGLGLILRWTPVAWLGGALVAGTFGLIFGALIAGGISGISSACVGIGNNEAASAEESGISSGTTFRLDLELSCGELEVARGSSARWTIQAIHSPDDPPAIDGSAAGLAVRQGGSSDIFVLSQEARNEWRIELPAVVAIDAIVKLNAAEGTVDLGPGELASFDGTFNAADVTIDLAEATTPLPARLDMTFNASSGKLALPNASVVARATLNVSSLVVCVPSGAEMRIEFDSTLASDDIGNAGLTKSGDGWQTAGYDTASSRIDLSITSTVSSFSLDRVEVCS
ncbi:MAG: hypothetical protein ACC726_06345 [Chloroflexota bacterium]